MSRLQKRSVTISSLFLVAMLNAAFGQAMEAPRPVTVISNSHGASCGWLVDWSTERNYEANDYYDHLDLVPEPKRAALHRYRPEAKGHP